MNHIIKKFAEQHQRKRKLRRRFISIFLAAALLVTAGVVWQMKDPGLSLSGNLICGKEEHQHTGECYEAILICGQEESEDQVIPGHQHTEACYEVHEICSCETGEHVHGDGCYDAEGNLTCALQEHTHTDGCYTEEQALVCGQEEAEDQVIYGHHHTDACYETRLVCGKEEHQHTADCIGKEEKQTEQKTEEQEAQDTRQETVIVQSPNSSASARRTENSSGRRMAAANIQLLAGETGIDFTEYITSITISRQEDGTWAPGTEFEVGDHVQVSISYRLDAGVVHPENRTIFYQMPEGITLSGQSEGYVDGGNGTTVGVYRITENGYIEITFSENFATGEAFEGNISFEGDIAAGESGGDYEISFGGSDTVITIKPDSDASALAIQKTGGFDYTAIKMNYSITVSSERGTGGNPVTIEDWFNVATGVTGLRYIENTLEIIKIAPDGTETEVEVSPSQIEAGMQDDTRPAFQISGLPALGPGEAYRLSYSVSAADEVTGGDGYIYLDNTARATAGTDRVTSNFNYTVTKTVVQKTGTYDAETGKITWTVLLNEDGRDIGGMWITDTMTTSDGQPLKIDGPIRIYDKNGNDTEYTIETLPYQIPKNFRETVYLVYETDVSGLAGQNDSLTVTNRVEIGPYEDTAAVEITGKGYGLTKTAVTEGIPEESEQYPGYGMIDWLSEISVPNDNVNLENLTYTDQLYRLTYNGVALDGIHLLNLALLAESLKIQTADGTALSPDTDYTVHYRDGSPIGNNADRWAYIDGFQIRFTEQALEKVRGKTIEIRYQTAVYLTYLVENGVYTVENAGRIPGYEVPAKLTWSRSTEFEKQVSLSGLNVTTGDSSSFTGDDLTVSYEQTGGILHYRLLLDTADRTGGNLTVTDILPEGVSLIRDSVKLAGHYHSQYGGSIDPGQQYIQTSEESTEDGRMKVTFIIDETAYHGKDYSRIAVYYDISIADDSAWDSSDTERKEYHNEAWWEGSYDGTSTTVTNEMPKLIKTGEQVPQYDENGQVMTDSDGNVIYSDLVRYYILINPKGDDLDPASEYLQLRDTLTIPDYLSAEFRADTAAIYHYDPSAVNGLGAPMSMDQYPVVYDKENRQITFSLPDGVPCVVVYEYSVDRRNAAAAINISNSAELTGVAQGSTSNEVTIEKVTSGASANKATVTIYKTDSTNSAKLLPGARFKLERYEQKPDGSYAWDTTSITAEGADGEFVVGESGRIVLSFLSEDEESGNGSRYHTLYRIHETEAPAGYEKSDRYYYFVWMKQGETEESAIQAMESQGIFGSGPEQVDPSQVVFIGFSQSASEYVPNTPTELTVQKLWYDAEGNPLDPEGLPESIEIQLYRYAEGQSKADAEPVENGKATLRADSDAEKNWKYTWTGLPKEDPQGKTYYYYVEEVSVPDGYAVSYSANNETGIQTGVLTVSNTKSERYLLPDTGGTGTLPLYLGGAGLLGAGTFWGVKRRGKSRKK